MLPTPLPLRFLELKDLFSVGTNSVFFFKYYYSKQINNRKQSKTLRSENTQNSSCSRKLTCIFNCLKTLCLSEISVWDYMALFIKQPK